MKVITTFLTAEPDPQRGAFMSPELTQFVPWADSVRRHGHRPVVLADHPVEQLACGLVEVVEVEPGPNPYFHRWRVVADYLEKEDGLVWVTDGTDVVMLRDPVPGMRCGPMYVGADVYPVGCNWMLRTCHGYRSWIRAHAGETLMNAGVLGGPALDVRLVARMIADEWPVEAVHDMAAFNKTLMQFAAEGWELVVGEPVNTTMHAYDHRHPTAWFAHK